MLVRCRCFTFEKQRRVNVVRWTQTSLKPTVTDTHSPCGGRVAALDRKNRAAFIVCVCVCVFNVHRCLTESRAQRPSCPALGPVASVPR